MDPNTSPATAHRSSDATESETAGDVRVPVIEERAVVAKRDVERLGARIHMRTHEEEVPFSETLRSESVEVERVASGIVVDEPPSIREEEGVLIVPVVEEVLVKRYRVVEEVRITSRAETVETTDTVTLRRQEAVVDETPSDPTAPD